MFIPCGINKIINISISVDQVKPPNVIWCQTQQGINDFILFGFHRLLYHRTIEIGFCICILHAYTNLRTSLIINIFCPVGAIQLAV